MDLQNIMLAGSRIFYIIWRLLLCTSFVENEDERIQIDEFYYNAVIANFEGKDVGWLKFIRH